MIQPENYRHPSLERPDFNIYKETITNGKIGKQAFIIAAKIENQQILEISVGTELDHLFTSFPKLENQ